MIHVERTDRENKLRSILLDLYTFLEKGHYDNDPAMDPFYEKIEEGLSLFTKNVGKECADMEKNKRMTAFFSYLAEHWAHAHENAQDKAFSRFIKHCKTKEVATMQNGISVDDLNKAVERESKCARFREAHRPAHCTQCGAEIMPGEEIWTIAAENCVFCDSECLAHYVLGYSLDIDCEGYSTYFDDMQGG